MCRGDTAGCWVYPGCSTVVYPGGYCAGTLPTRAVYRALLLLLPCPSTVSFSFFARGLVPVSLRWPALFRRPIGSRVGLNRRSAGERDLREMSLSRSRSRREESTPRYGSKSRSRRDVSTPRGVPQSRSRKRSQRLVMSLRAGAGGGVITRR